jgi:hypothetical protein
MPMPSDVAGDDDFKVVFGDNTPLCAMIAKQVSACSALSPLWCCR